MAACPSGSCDGVDASSLAWFKISEATNDGTTWASATIANTLNWSFDIPADIAPGAYLIRHEIIAMHTVGAPQVYPYCFQANVVGGGSAVPGDTTTFPAAYSLNEDFKTWDIYNGAAAASFVAPGPAVYGGGGGGRSPAPAPAPSSSVAASSVVVAPSSSAVPPSTSVAAASSSAVTSSPTPEPSSSVAPVGLSASAS
jgi:hypothetical protein